MSTAAEETLEAILACYPEREQQEQITRACHIAEEAMKDKLRENRHPFIEHPLGVARIVAEDILRLWEPDGKLRRICSEDE